MILKATNLTKRYKSGNAVDNISIQLKSGGIYGLLGKNGAGKTTLFKLLTNLITPDEGFLKINSAKLKPIGAIIENPGLYSYLNAYENLKIFAEIQNAPRNEVSLQEYLKNVGLPIDRKDAVRNFSMGIKQRLAIAIALLNDPEIIILDEPFSGLDPTGVSALIQLIKSLAANNKAVLISSHLMNELQNCCNYLYVIDSGKIVIQGETNVLFENCVSTYIIKGDGIEKAENLLPNLISAEVNRIAIKCTTSEISEVLRMLLEKEFLISSCTPQVTLDELLNPIQNVI
ncbi:ABC transporter ATP-binding protein [Zunongwangia sp. HGR-M22]|uniref:ABC transporter ATP-binding protein n=1 Tax=Zunongwangia sp. HGR-M22 TaxID=3015168 RepID=UPI0022DD50F1|nr:ABC transporter ATP-binding protein [Zunongwangia sp. HGR-M22]WBL24150.1 ABC transporter ATP-binding protein [Zunongwangia sp. HGR-M22]